MQLVWALLMVLLPQRLRREVATRFLGWQVHPTAFIGRSLVVARRVSLGPGASIGPFNVIRDLEELRLDEGANIASRNWIVGMPLHSAVFRDVPDRDPSLVLGRYAQITVGHDIDCIDRVELGDYAVIAGFRSAVLTHSLNFVTDRFVTGKVVLGERSVLLSGSTMLSGTQLPARSIVSAGSVVTTKLTAEQTFYRGNPAQAVRRLPDNLKFFKREGRQAQIEAEAARLSAGGQRLEDSSS